MKSLFIDLHTHSNASDGTLSPSELVQKAYSAGLAAMAITDHDTMQGVDEAEAEAARLGIRLIPGIEMSCAYKDRELHILGYKLRSFAGIKEKEAAYSALAEFAKERENRNREIIRRLANDGINIEYEELYFGNPDTRITRAHFARALEEKGYVSSRSAAFDKYLVYGGRYVPVKTTDMNAVMSFFRKFGFFSSLAHPYQYRLSYAELDEVIDSLKTLGLNAIEVYHSSHRPSDTARLRETAQSKNLLISGGSDFHGANKPDISIGTGYGRMRIPLSLLEEMDRYIQTLQK